MLEPCELGRSVLRSARSDARRILRRVASTTAATCAAPNAKSATSPSGVRAGCGATRMRCCSLPAPTAWRDVWTTKACRRRFASSTPLIAREARRWHADIAHIHWLPNGIIGHARFPGVCMSTGTIADHGRGRRLVYCANPRGLCCGPCFHARPSEAPRTATWGIRFILLIVAPDRFDVLVNARAHEEKGSATAFEALRQSIRRSHRFVRGPGWALPSRRGHGSGSARPQGAFH